MPRGWSLVAARPEPTQLNEMNLLANKSNRKSGFTLVELTIVVVILGVLATFAIPRYMRVVERSKAAEAFVYLAEIQSGQAIFHAQKDIYADDLLNLDISVPDPNHFLVAAPVAADFETEWSVTLTRDGAAAGFGPYTVVFTHLGFDELNSTIPANLIAYK